MPPFSKKRTEKGIYPAVLHRDDPNKPVAYINMTILDASEAVYGMVHSKLVEKQENSRGPKLLPESFKKKVAEKVAKAASTKVPPKAIAETLSKKMPQKLMYMMYHKTGMRVAAQTVFVENTYVVMQLQVQYVDSMRLLSQAKEGDEDKDDDESVASAVIDEWIDEQNRLNEEEMGSSFVTTSETEKETDTGLADCFKGTSIKEIIINILTWILLKLGGTDVHRSLEEQHLPALVQSKITENMQEMMAKQLETKSLKAEVVVLPETKESRYFFQHLQQVRNRESSTSTTTEG